jgi:hypothetical protein
MKKLHEAVHRLSRGEKGQGMTGHIWPLSRSARHWDSWRAIRDRFLGSPDGERRHSGGKGGPTGHQGRRFGLGKMEVAGPHQRRGSVEAHMCGMSAAELVRVHHLAGVFTFI